ncbi:hypothetical protein AVEN_219906-1 [Araneus ventricosus]|uniref:Uncharacterized protein n=1 Tax=Araneus ventricosus TaxID=182803 RepID=A0A4Y2M2I8_ARAVE|nr:hypothetical protein AVEN_219906-1 [Araneus ventricosus]
MIPSNQIDSTEDPPCKQAWSVEVHSPPDGVNFKYSYFACTDFWELNIWKALRYLHTHALIQVDRLEIGRPHSFSGMKRTVGACTRADSGKMPIACRRLPLRFADAVSCGRSQWHM